MRIQFLEIHADRDWSLAAIGPACLAGMLRQHGHEAHLQQVKLTQSLDEIVAEVMAAKPDLIGLSLTTRQWLRAQEVVQALRQRTSTPVIAGGLHPTFSPERVLASPGFDFICLGEGEEALLELVQRLEQDPSARPVDVQNIWSRGASRPALRPPFEPIDALPWMARDMLAEVHGVVHMVTQRGCPFPCTYCGARKFHDLYRGVGSYGRRRSHENVLNEIRSLQSQQLVSYIIFLDDTFTLAPSWIQRFCEIYGEELAIPFSIHARAETVNIKMLKSLAAAGCRHITYGVESGSERVRTDILKRVVSNSHLEEVFRWTRDLGIMVTSNYIIGIPGETRAEIEQTIELHHLLKPDDFGYFVFYPYPGTALFHTCEAQGYLPEDFWQRPANHRETILNLPGLSAADVSEFYDRFTRIREAEYLARHASALTTMGEEQAAKSIQISASQG
jgi:radical SAM superfamily enzyme YgiQ (UPF0313 family)